MHLATYLEERQEEGYDLFPHDKNGNVERLRVM